MPVVLWLTLETAAKATWTGTVRALATKETLSLWAKAQSPTKFVQIWHCWLGMCLSTLTANKYHMQITISMQAQLGRTEEGDGPGYDVVTIIDEIGAAKAAGELTWVNRDEPLRLDIQIVD